MGYPQLLLHSQRALAPSPQDIFAARTQASALRAPRCSADHFKNMRMVFDTTFCGSLVHVTTNMEWYGLIMNDMECVWIAGILRQSPFMYLWFRSISLGSWWKSSNAGHVPAIGTGHWIRELSSFPGTIRWPPEVTMPGRPFKPAAPGWSRAARTTCATALEPSAAGTWEGGQQKPGFSCGFLRPKNLKGWDPGKHRKSMKIPIAPCRK